MEDGLFRSTIVFDRLGASTPSILAASSPGHSTVWDVSTYWFCGWGPMLLGAVIVLAIWVGVVVIDRLAIQRKINEMSGTDQQSGARRSALTILEGRFARGEIDREEFLSKKRDLD